MSADQQRGSVRKPTERRCIEPGCAAFPDATWDRCALHQDAHESTVSEPIAARAVRVVSEPSEGEGSG